jgi:secondary thiamine-phosphate synthase enzyme
VERENESKEILMAIQHGRISIKTLGETDICNITEDLEKLVSGSNLRSGILTVFCPSSTSSVTTLEYEPGAVTDLKRMFEELVSSKRNYAHNATWGDGNGYSHMRAALLGPSLTIPFVENKLTLGTWQQVVYVDFDIRPRQRELIVQLVGE